MIEWLLEHRFFLVIVCIAAVMGVSALIDWINRQLAVHFQIRMPHRILVVISTILVVLTYCTVFALTAAYMRLRGRRLLPQTRREATSTYWTEREKIEPTLDSLRRQG